MTWQLKTYRELGLGYGLSRLPASPHSPAAGVSTAAAMAEQVKAKEQEIQGLRNTIVGLNRDLVHNNAEHQVAYPGLHVTYYISCSLNTCLTCRRIRKRWRRC